MYDVLANPLSFFAALGGLHDADIARIEWEAVARSLSVEVDDLNANFYGLPEYQGKQPAKVIFSEVQDLSINCDGLEGDVQRIYRLQVEEKKDAPRQFGLEILIAPSGRIELNFRFVAIERHLAT